MLIDPKNIVFETRDDVIDFVTKGFIPPKKSNFEKVMNKVKNPDDEATFNSNKGKEVTILDSAMNEEERKLLEEMMNRVYGNRVSNRNKLFTGISFMTAGSIGAALLYRLIKNKK